MSHFDKIQNVLWGVAQELAAEIYNPEKHPDEFETLAEDMWLEMCEEEGVDPYA